MNMIDMQSGKIYRVTHREFDGKLTTAKRIFKWHVKDGLGVNRLVFSSKIRGKVDVEWDEAKKTLTIAGKSIPKSELLIPVYCLIKTEEEKRL